MEQVTVVNLRFNKADFICDRTSPLGNPLTLEKEFRRNYVCDQYDEYFHRCLNPDESPPGFLEYLDEILQAAKNRPITLGCWCAPRRCHCDTIKSWLDLELSNNDPP